MTQPYYFYKQTLLHPEVYQSQMLAKFVQGRFVERGEYVSPFVRAQIISFDAEGSLLENPDGSGECDAQNPTTNEHYKIPARKGPKNPPRSLRARLLSKDRFTSNDNLRIYYPMFPSAGIDPTLLEYVYVIFEDSDKNHGLWLAQVCGPDGESRNFASGNKPYQDNAHGENDKSLASCHGDVRQKKQTYDDNESITGAPVEQSSKKDLDYNSPG